MDSPSKITKEISSIILDGKVDVIFFQLTCLKNITRPAVIIVGMNYGLVLIGEISVNLFGPKMEDKGEKP